MSQRRQANRGVRLVIRAPDPRGARVLQDRLARAEIDAVALAGTAAARPAPDGEDLTVIDADAGDAETLAKALRRDLGTSLALIGATKQAPLRPSLFDGWLALGERPALMRRVLDDLRRDGVCREEARSRRRTAAALGLPAAPERPPPKTMTALFVGPPNTAFLAFEHAWLGQAGHVGATFTSFSAFDQLHDERFDAVILNAIDDAPATVSLASAMARNADLYHAPILALVDKSDSALERGAHMLVTPDQDFAYAAAWLAEAVDRARRRSGVLQVLKAIPEPQSPWLASTLIGHLETLAGAHHSGGRPLSIATLRLASSAPAQKDWRARFTELAGLTARLIRASDSIAALDDATLLLAFPCTDQDGARAALTRITSVWEHTAFIADENKSASLRCHQGVFELAPGESGPALLVRASEDLFRAR